MNKKGNIPSIRDLRDAIAKEKKNTLDTDSRHLRLRIYVDRWELEGGSSQFFSSQEEGEEGLTHSAYFVVDRYSSSYEMARKTVDVVRGALVAETCAAALSVVPRMDLPPSRDLFPKPKGRCT